MRRGLFLSYDSDLTDYRDILYRPIFKTIRKNNILIESVAVGNVNKKSSNDIIIPFGTNFLQKCISFLYFYLYLNKKLKSKFDFIISRSLIPSFFLILLRQKSEHIPLIFDCDGFMHMERLENNTLSRNSIFFKLFCWIEQKMFRRAKIILVRTNEAAKIVCSQNIKFKKKIHIFSNGRDPKVFFPKKTYSDTTLKITYLGSIGPQYLPWQMIKLYKYLKKTNLDLMFSIYCSNLKYLPKKLLNEFNNANIKVSTLKPEKAANALRNSDVGLNFRRACPSTKAIFPIKISEYLLSGVPVISSKNIGDLDKLSIPKSCFKSFSRLNKKTLQEIFEFCTKNFKKRKKVSVMCRKIGIKHFALAKSVQQLNRAISRLNI